MASQRHVVDTTGQQHRLRGYWSGNGNAGLRRKSAWFSFSLSLAWPFYPAKSDRPMIASRQTQRSGGSPTSNGEHPGSLYVALNDVAPSPRA